MSGINKPFFVIGLASKRNFLSAIMNFSSAMLLLLGVVASSAPASAQTGTLYRLNQDSAFQQGCFPPCLCPIMIAVPVEGSGTTWALLGFSHVQRNRTHAIVSFEQGAKSVGKTPIDLMTPEQGRLKLTVLSDDSGQPAPAMVRLVWKTDGRSRQPGNGIDFGPQFDHLGSPEHIANLPGKLRGPYWVMPGPIDMSLQVRLLRRLLTACAWRT